MALFLVRSIRLKLCAQEWTDHIYKLDKRSEKLHP